MPKLSNRELIDKKTGNNADLKLLLNTMLIEAGFDTEFILISSRNHGKLITSYSYLGQFDAAANLVKLKNGETT